ncbi:MAG: quinoprotein dehydrogenase-associated putative ABC transporter substrate-binding protein [Rhodomicrobiaceae bacterium]
MFKRFVISSFLIAQLGAWLPSTALATEEKSEAKKEHLFNLYERNFDQLTSAEKTAAKKAARYVVKNKLYKNLRVCADPGNMPLSNNKGEGFQNKIAELVAAHIGAELSYFYRPYLERGLTRQTFTNRECDLLMDMPVNYGQVLTTEPIYRSTYVFATRKDRNIIIKDFSDRHLKSYRIGVYQHSGIREALARHGIKEELDIHVISHNADLVKENQPWRQVQKVIDGKLDIAGVWGPFAGFLISQKKQPIVLQAVNIMDDQVPLEFSVGIGVVKSNALLKYVLDTALNDNAEKITKILNEFGVPLVKCSKCVVAGSLKSHGSYFKRFKEAGQRRYTETLKKSQVEIDKSLADEKQLVSMNRLKKWLKEGSNLNQELQNAVLASSFKRIDFLIKNGADINAPDPNGFTALQNAARSRDTEVVNHLIKLKANLNKRDKSGWTTLMHAAYRNHVPTIKALVTAGANLNLKTPEGITALGLALGERQFYAADALIEAGCDLSIPIGPEVVSPLMILATQKKADARSAMISQGISVIDLAKKLVAKGANVNASSAKGVTALMIAAGHNNSQMIGILVRGGADIFAKSMDGKTALDIAKISGSKNAEKSLAFFENTKRKNH